LFIAAELDLPSETGSIGRRKLHYFIIRGSLDRPQAHRYFLVYADKVREPGDKATYHSWALTKAFTSFLRCTGPSITGGIHWYATVTESLDSGSDSDDEIGSIAPPPADDKSR
jgi:hypothetical protein